MTRPFGSALETQAKPKASVTARMFLPTPSIVSMIAPVEGSRRVTELLKLLVTQTNRLPA